MQNLSRLALAREFSDITKKNKIITYERNESINGYLSRMSDLRIIWGGDTTVASFKALPTQPHCKDICFPDRFSFSAINASKYKALSEDHKKTIAGKFYNDSFWFDQMACSSPQVVFFVGDDVSNVESSKHFKTMLDEVIKEKGYKRPISNTMDHLVRWYSFAADEAQQSYKKITQDSSTFFKTTLSKLNHEYKSCGGGFFLECHIHFIDELIAFNSKKDQTMTCYGFEKEELVRLVNLKGTNSPCRLIPFGSALNFDYLWDGYNLLTEFTKAISIAKAY